MPERPALPRAESEHVEVGQIWLWAGHEYRVEQIKNDCARVERVDDAQRWAWLPLKQFRWDLIRTDNA